MMQKKMKKDISPVLRIEHALPRGVVFSQSPLSNNSVKTWHAVVTRTLELAFLGRPVCLITPAETASTWDLDYSQLSREHEVYVIGGYRYLCAFDPGVSLTTLKEVAESQAFYLGPVWIAPLTKVDKDRLFALVAAQLKAGLFGWPQTDEEIFYCNPDGDFVYWLNPSKAEETILDELRRLAREASWRVESEDDAR